MYVGKYTRPMDGMGMASKRTHHLPRPVQVSKDENLPAIPRSLEKADRWGDRMCGPTVGGEG